VKSIDELAGDLNFTTAKTGEDRSVTFLPDPPRARRRYTVISADDHIVEPPDTFTGRLPRKFADRAPKVVDTENGGQTWVYDVRNCRMSGSTPWSAAGVGVRFRAGPVRRNAQGAWDIHARVKDMDLNGIYASLNFPSFLPGFAASGCSR